MQRNFILPHIKRIAPLLNISMHLLADKK